MDAGQKISPRKNNNNVWVEKYRPVEFNEIILDKYNRLLFEKILEKKKFPNLLFYGPPGTGKTTTIINLINEYQTKYYRKNNTNILHLNASDERGIDIIRNQIFQFVKTNNLFEEGLKFVILDEVDYMTKNAQQALKYLLQTSFENQNVRFSLICNYISKIDEGVRNEFICIRFNQLPTEEIINLMRRICNKESIHGISDETILSIKNTYGSDIRSMINFLQLHQHLDEEKKDEIILNESTFQKMLNQFQVSAYTHSQVATNIQFMYEISSTYNIETKSIILQFFHFYFETYFLGSKADGVTPHKTSINEFIDIFQLLIDNDELEEDTLIYAFVVKMLLFF
jgi:DNA polymerase III delta prime subunit